MFLDSNTLFIAIACASLFSAALLMGIYRLNPGESSIAVWAAGNTLIGLGSVLASLQADFPSPVTVILPYLTLTAGTALLVAGLMRFIQSPTRPVVLSGLIAAQFAVHAYFVYVQPLLWARLLSTSALLTLLALWPLAVLRQRRWGEYTYSVAVPYLLLGFALQAVTHCLWMIHTLWTLPVGPLFRSQAPSASMALLQILCTSIILNISFVLLVMERIHRLLRVKVAIDDLTGVFNRRAFNQIADVELARADRSHAWPALMVLDLDHFKHVNDRYGHHAGDEVLRQFGVMLKSCTRAGDIVARMGGEEFAALLPATDLEQATAVAERIRSTLEQTAFRVDHHEFHVTTSIGLTILLPEDTLHAAFVRADHALYAAKDAGRNRVVTRTEPLPRAEPARGRAPDEPAAPNTESRAAGNRLGPDAPDIMDLPAPAAAALSAPPFSAPVPAASAPPASPFF